MTLEKFSRKYNLPADYNISLIPIKHPETGKKIYIYNIWRAGFWYTHRRGVKNGRIWPYQYYGKILELETHRDAPKELGAIKINKK